jgi:hypothetical protein
MLGRSFATIALMAAVGLSTEAAAAAQSCREVAKDLASPDRDIVAEARCERENPVLARDLEEVRRRVQQEQWRREEYAHTSQQGLDWATEFQSDPYGPSGRE